MTNIKKSNYKKGNIIKGRFNVSLGTAGYEMCTRIFLKEEGEYLRLNDVRNYKIELFPYYENKEILNGIDVMEALDSSNTYKFISNQFVKLAPKYNLILINQKYVDSIITNETSYRLKYMEGIEVKDDLIPMFILPKENDNVYMINMKDGVIESYIRLNNDSEKYSETYPNRFMATL